MNNFHIIAGWVAGIISLTGYIYYNVRIAKGDRTNPTTWILYSLVNLLIGSSYLASGATTTVIMVFSTVIGAIFTSVHTLKKTPMTWVKADKWYMIISALSLIPWIVYHSPQVTLFINIFINLLGTISLLSAIQRRTVKEKTFSWIIFFTASLVNLLAINHLSLTIAAFPIYVFLANTSVLIFVIIFPTMAKNKKF